MKYHDTIIRKLPSGGFKVCVWGSADMHVSDRRGCNHRITTVSAPWPSRLQWQPNLGFKTIEQAVEWAHLRFPGGDGDAATYARTAGDGTHLTPDGDLKDWVAERLFK
mgnify:CR=1 FL=1